ncbi:hypothetical protein EGX06_03550 [Enterococcus hirae]|nr:hypothetical protein EGX06_03550 [Enterococcus hirae]
MAFYTITPSKNSSKTLGGVICVKQQTFYVHFKNNHLE